MVVRFIISSRSIVTAAVISGDGTVGTCVARRRIRVHRLASTFIEPVISTTSVTTEFVRVAPGLVAGIHQGASDASGRITLDLRMYVGAPDPGDTIEIHGEPDIRVKVEGGYHGDVATCAITLNAAMGIRNAAPGFRTMLDLPVVHSRFR